MLHSDIVDGYKAIRQMLGAVIRFDAATEIRSIKFIDDDDIMMLIETEGELCLPRPSSGRTKLSIDTFHLLKMPYQKQSVIHYKPLEGSVAQQQLPGGKAGRITSNLELSEEQIREYAVHTFPPEERFKPLRMEVNGRKDRRFVTVIGEDLRHLRIFDLDFKAEDEGPTDGDVVMHD